MMVYLPVYAQLTSLTHAAQIFTINATKIDMEVLDRRETYRSFISIILHILNQLVSLHKVPDIHIIILG